MFTGIIEEVGAVKQITHGQHSEVLNIQARTVLENTKIGDSISRILTTVPDCPDELKP